MRLLHHAAALMLATALLAACGTPAPSASPSATASAAPETPTEPTPTETTPPTAAGSPTPVPIADDPPPVALEVVADGLADPIGIASAPGGWLLVNERAGRVVAIHGGERSIALDITDRVLGEDERGLLGLVLHPDWPEDGRAFVHYSDRGSDGDTVLSEFTGTQDGDAAPVLDPASERVLLTVDQPFANHNGGQLAFGPDGYLWFGLGDGGSGGDPLGNGQNPFALLGSILRLDVSEPGGYAVPPDNPFADGSGGAPEVYLVGLRNPWRFSFDPESGLLWIADVGQIAYEEIDRIDPAAAAGANLGWNLMEGSHCFADAACSSDGLVTAAGRVRPRPGLLGDAADTSIAAARSTGCAAGTCSATTAAASCSASDPMPRSPPTAARWRRASCSRRGAGSAASAPTRTATSTSPTSAVERCCESWPAADRGRRWRASSSIGRAR